MNKLLVFFGAVALGAGLMYVYEIAAGQRSLPSYRFESIWWSLAKLLPAQMGEDLRRQMLASRVRAEIDDVLGRPHAIEVAVSDGRVSLRGGVREDEFDPLLTRVARIPGVAGIDNGLVGLQTMENG